MLNHFWRKCPPIAVAAVAATALTLAGAWRGRLTMADPVSPPQTVTCRVLESHTSPVPTRRGEALELALVIFHQSQATGRARVADFLRAQSGTTVAFRTRDGQSHRATVLRLKSCFGRGVLLFPAETAQLAEGDEFELEIPM